MLDLKDAGLREDSAPGFIVGTNCNVDDGAFELRNSVY